MKQKQFTTCDDCGVVVPKMTEQEVADHRDDLGLSPDDEIFHLCDNCLNSYGNPQMLITEARA